MALQFHYCECNLMHVNKTIEFLLLSSLLHFFAVVVVVVNTSFRKVRHISYIYRASFSCV